MTVHLQFGPAGNPDVFYQLGYKRSLEMPAYLRQIGLQAYEYQLSKGVNIGQATAEKIGRQCRECSISTSVHAPYYISLATADRQTAANTAGHFLKSLRAASWLTADRVVFHIGGVGRQDRKQALAVALRRMEEVLALAEQEDLLKGIALVPESHGKINQLGSLDEIIAFCRLSPLLLPGIDFGHMHAVTNGGFGDIDSFRRVLATIGEQLLPSQVAGLHIHFSQLEYTAAGEKRHGRFGEGLGPPFEPMIDALLESGISARIICESDGSQTEDALTMQDYYRKKLPVASRS
ncbi:MAG: TIM barrel protein [Negativicutes bacterium]|nr:TIM barrel protein [Negativicutes bacterium]